MSMDLSIEGWPDRMRDKGHHVQLVGMADSPWFSCVLYVKEKGVVVNIFSGYSDESLIHAIKKCQDKFGLNNIMVAISNQDTRARQRANINEVRRLLSE